MMAFSLALLFSLGGATGAWAQDRPRRDRGADGGRPAEQAQSSPPPRTEPPREAKHTMTLNGKPFEYLSTTGFLPLKDESGKVEANIFFVAYTKPGAEPGRPLMFAFNGGPGAAAVWLHVGGIGPRRVVMEADGTVLARRNELTENESTWLDLCDLVFVDPVGTGYSRAAGGDGKRYYAFREDVRSLSQFIRLYITQYSRWLSPIYLTGESYGSTRVAAMAQRLQSDHGIYPRGVVMISSVLDFQTILPDQGTDLPYVLGLPSCAATAWYHKRLPPALQQRPLEDVLRETEQWAIKDFLPALARGDALSAEDEGRIAGQLAQFTGLPRQLILNHRLRISTAEFARELMRDSGKFLGFMDGRVIGVASSPSSAYEPFDPAFFLTIGPYAATFNDYVNRELRFFSPLKYEWLSREVHGAWRYEAEGHYLYVTDNLGQAMAANTRLRVFNAAGIYDLTTPYFSQEYALNRLGLDASLRGHVTTKRYASGHQLYTSLGALHQLKADVAEFMRQPDGPDD